MSVTTVPKDPRVIVVEEADLSQVVAYLEHQGGLSREDILKRVEEYRRYHLMLRAHPDKRLPICSKVDVIWHTHIIFTEHYARFCVAVHGRFRHHQPSLSKNDRLKLREDYQRNTVPTYVCMFGTPPDGFWEPLDMVCMGGDGEGGD